MKILGKEKMSNSSKSEFRVDLEKIKSVPKKEIDANLIEKLAMFEKYNVFWNWGWSSVLATAGLKHLFKIGKGDFPEFFKEDIEVLMATMPLSAKKRPYLVVVGALLSKTPCIPYPDHFTDQERFMDAIKESIWKYVKDKEEATIVACNINIFSCGHRRRILESWYGIEN